MKRLKFFSAGCVSRRIFNTAQMAMLGVIFLCMTTLLFSIGQEDARGQDSNVLIRTLDDITVADDLMDSATANYRPIFGTGDTDAAVPKGLERYGHLSIDGEGGSAVFNYSRMELVYYVLGGTGLLNYGDRQVPISEDDFFYIPVDKQHGFENPRGLPLDMIVMSFPIPDEAEITPTPELMIASAREVDFQVLEQNNHGPTSSFRLLMGTTFSRRDRLAAAMQMNSLYVIDFEPGGTNIPHRHPNEEEIYFVLQGTGDMVAGETENGEESRYAAKPGDVFFFGRNELVGFYNQDETVEHARILAVRHKYPE